MTEESRLAGAAREAQGKAETCARQKPVEVPSRAVRVNVAQIANLRYKIVRAAIPALQGRPMLVGAK